MLIDFSELVDLLERVGDTKIQVLQSCITPKHWSEIVEIIKKSEPTLLVHINDLMKMRLLDKNEETRTYLTTEKGVEFLKLEPHVRDVQKGKPKEYFRLINRGVQLGHLSLREKFLLQALGADTVNLDKNLKKVYEDASRAMLQAVTVWLPHGFEPDKTTYRIINKLIGEYTKTQSDPKLEKMTMIIEFDLPTAIDMIIRDEKDEKIKQRLEQEKDEIIKRIYKNWHRIFL
jgi:DNA-binding transcriptional ArsR family regulator